MVLYALTCINGCFCWSADEENRPGFFLTMDALYRLSQGAGTCIFPAHRPVCEPPVSVTKLLSLLIRNPVGNGRELRSRIILYRSRGNILHGLNRGTVVPAHTRRLSSRRAS